MGSGLFPSLSWLLLGCSSVPILGSGCSVLSACIAVVFSTCIVLYIALPDWEALILAVNMCFLKLPQVARPRRNLYKVLVTDQ